MAQTSTNSKSEGSEIPENLRDILFARGEYESDKLEQIKMAFDDGDKNRVFTLVEELIYGGPGTIKRL